MPEKKIDRVTALLCDLSVFLSKREKKKPTKTPPQQSERNKIMKPGVKKKSAERAGRNHGEEAHLGGRGRERR